MITTGNRVYFQFRSDPKSKRVLHPAVITESSGGSTYMAMLDESDPPVSPGENALVFFERQRVFTQQPVRIDAVLSHDGFDAPVAKPCDENDDVFSFGNSSLQIEAHVESVDDTVSRVLIGFETTGEPVSAESRQCYRVLTSISSNVTAIVDGANHCPVLDVSATGFSIMSNAPIRIGQVVRVTLQHEQREFSGSAVVQSIREFDDGRNRLGLYCAGDERSNGELFKGLQQIGACIQREQIRRISGSA